MWVRRSASLCSGWNTTSCAEWYACRNAKLTRLLQGATQSCEALME